MKTDQTRARSRACLAGKDEITPIFQLSFGELDQKILPIDFLADALIHMGHAVRHFYRDHGTYPTRIYAEPGEGGDVKIECRGVRYAHASYRVDQDGQVVRP